MSVQQYVGPTSLEEALANAEAHDGIRLAVSCPNGSIIAVEVDGQVFFREVATLSGRCGSVLGTGGWVVNVPSSVSWRPA